MSWLLSWDSSLTWREQKANHRSRSYYSSLKSFRQQIAFIFFFFCNFFINPILIVWLWRYCFCKNGSSNKKHRFKWYFSKNIEKKSLEIVLPIFAPGIWNQKQTTVDHIAISNHSSSDNDNDNDNDDDDDNGSSSGVPNWMQIIIVLIKLH